MYHAERSRRQRKAGAEKQQRQDTEQGPVSPADASSEVAVEASTGAGALAGEVLESRPLKEYNTGRATVEQKRTVLFAVE